MTQHANPRLLKGTRAVLYLSLGLVALVGLVIALATPLMAWKWDEILIELADGGKVRKATEVYPYAVAVLALLVGALGILWKMLKTLLDLVRSVEDGTPFSRLNAALLRMVGWLMIAIQVVGIPLALLAARIEEIIDPAEASNDLGISLNSVLAILIAFILAGVFEQGAEMREELEGTV